jgi:hypothetical protein
MKLIIVDLYGDGTALRVLEDTPQASAAIDDFLKAESAAIEAVSVNNWQQPPDMPSFSDFVEERGCKLFCTRTIAFDRD